MMMILIAILVMMMVTPALVHLSDLEDHSAFTVFTRKLQDQPLDGIIMDAYVITHLLKYSSNSTKIYAQTRGKLHT